VATQPSNQSRSAASYSVLAEKEPKIRNLSLVLTDNSDEACTSDKKVKISRNMWRALTQDGQYYLLCHEAGHYLEGHNRSSNFLVCLAAFSIALWPFCKGITSYVVALIGFIAFGMLAAYNRQWIMQREYQADSCGYRLLEEILPGAYLKGMVEVNQFHKNRDSERLSGTILKKRIEMREKHLELKMKKLKATYKIQ